MLGGVVDDVKGAFVFEAVEEFGDGVFVHTYTIPGKVPYCNTW